MIPSYQKIELFIESDKKMFTGYGKGKETLNILSANFNDGWRKEQKNSFLKGREKVEEPRKSHKKNLQHPEKIK